MAGFIQVMSKCGINVMNKANEDPLKEYSKIPLNPNLEPFRHLFSQKFFDYRAKLLFFQDRYILPAHNKLRKWKADVTICILLGVGIVKEGTYFHTYDIGRIAAAHPFYVSYDHMVCIFWKA